MKGIQKDIVLAPYTTFRIGGPAKHFYVAKTRQGLIKAIKLAKDKNLPFFILGGGSKLLVSDKGFEGIVIKVKSSELKVKSYNSKFKIISTEAGVKLSNLITLFLAESLTGLEWAAGIPMATIGGAIRGNAGAFGACIKDVVQQVAFLDVNDFKIKTFNNKDCQFDYRNSAFKQNPNLIIISADLKLEKGNKEKIRQKIKEIFDYRKARHPMNFPSAGSVFINPRLRQGYGGHAKNQSAGSLIEQCSLKEKTIGNAQISEKHANFIVNLGNAKANDVIQLIELVKKQVKKKFDIELKEEIQYLGF